MDVVLADSALEMASVVAWADWMINCCGVRSPTATAMMYYYVVVGLDLKPCLRCLDSLIMVRLGKAREGGRIQKWLYLRNHWSNLLQTWTVYTWGYALPLGGIVFVQMISWVHTGVQNASRVFFWQKKQGRIQPEVVPIVLKCFLDIQCPVLHHCNPLFSSIVHRKKEFLERQELFAQLTATMMYYYVVVVVVKGWLQVWLKHSIY